MTNELKTLGTALMICCGLAVTACSESSDTGSESPPATSVTGTATGTSAASQPECEDVADSARTLATDLGGLLSGSVTADQVRTDAEELSESVTAAKEVVTSNVREQWDDAEAAIGRARDVLATQPLDMAALRESVSDALTALDDAVPECAPDAGSIPNSVPATTSAAPTS